MENQNDPFAQGGGAGQPGGGGGQTPPFNNQNAGLQEAPNSTAILILGICSIVFAFCYGIVGVILGIIALVMANKSLAEVKANPGRYNKPTNVNAGRICGIIGLSIGAIYFVIIIIYLVVFGAAMASAGMF